MTPAPDLTALADKLDELAKKATTRGPWKVTNGGLGIEGQPDAASDFDPVVIGGCKGGKGLIDFPSYGIYSTPGRKEGEANAALIVALRNALPQITTALREAARMREVEAERDRMAKALAGAFGLLQLMLARADIPAKTRRVIESNHRFIEASAALKQEESRG